MKLYEITNRFSELFEEFDDISSFTPDTDANGNPLDFDGNIITDVDRFKSDMLQAWFDTLTAIEGEFEEKAESLAVYIKNISAEAKAVKAEEQNLRARRQSLERQAAQLKKYLLASMNQIGRGKIEMPKAKISVRKNAESLVIEDEIGFINWAQSNNEALLKYSLPEIKKNTAKILVKGGERLPFCHLERSQSLIVK